MSTVEAVEAALTVVEGGKDDTDSTGIDLSDKSGPLVGSTAWATKIRRRARELSKTLDTGYMELARILYQVYDTPIDGDPRRGPIFQKWGYDTFKDYAQQELGLHPKKAERLRHIWFVLEVKLKDLPQETKQRIVNLGFAKVRELVKVLTARNASSLVGDAEAMNYKQLEATVTEERRRLGLAEAVLGDTDASTDTNERTDALNPDASSAVIEKPTREHFDLFPGQLANVRLALQRAAELSNSSKKGHQLDLICSDFIATNDSLASDVDKRLRYLAKIERTLGLRLVAVDPESKDIIYGIDALKMVADE